MNNIEAKIIELGFVVRVIVDTDYAQGGPFWEVKLAGYSFGRFDSDKDAYEYLNRFLNLDNLVPKDKMVEGLKEEVESNLRTIGVARMSSGAGRERDTYSPIYKKAFYDAIEWLADN